MSSKKQKKEALRNAVVPLVASLLPSTLSAAYDLFLDHGTISVSISEKDPLFQAAHAWIARTPRTSSLFSKLSLRAESSQADVNLKPTAGTFVWEQRTFWTTVQTSREAPQSLSIFCYGRDPEPIHQLLRHMMDMANPGKEFAKVHTPEIREWEWTSSQAKRARPLSTIDLDGNLKEEIVADITRFLDPETKCRYLRKGQPYRRGLLFSGPPGTGKSSLATALATEFGMGIYMVSISCVRDETFAELVKKVPENSLILLEDIDSAGVKRDSNHRGDGVTLSGLLNVMDGLLAPENVIFILTTNAVEELDKALIRPGRADRQFLLDKATKDLGRKMFMRLYDEHDSVEELSERFADKLPDRQISPAELQGFMQLHPEVPEIAIKEIASFVAKVVEDKRQKAEAKAKKRAADRKQKKHEIEDDSDSDSDI